MTQTNVPLGPLGKILVVTESGIVGRCVGTFWPASGAFGEITVDLRTSDGAVHKVLLTSVREPSDGERSSFLDSRR